MKPTLLFLGLGSLIAWFSRHEHPVEGRWVTDGERGHDIVLMSTDGHLGGSGTWLTGEGGQRCRVSLDMSFVSEDQHRYIGTLTGEDECRGQKTTLDCSLSADASELDCGEGLHFTRKAN